MKLSYLNLTTTDPAFNLAVEEYVFNCLPRDRMYVMLWQNDNAIIIGKHQNALAQINQAFVKERDIRIVRRLSGGGAVYHDLGNLNFTVIADAQGVGLDFGRFCDMVIAALEKAGLQAQRNGRNDMVIDGKKFSGNAQYIKDGRVMHHGTLLFDSDMTVLSQALQVDEEKIRSKGVKSVRSRVTNIRPLLPEEMTLAQFRRLLLESILERFPGEEYRLTEQDLATIETLKSRYESWDWNFGRSPACTLVKHRRMEGCGSVEAYMTLEKGVLTELRLRGDFFGEPEALEQALAGCPLTEAALSQALADMDVGLHIRGLTKAQLTDLLCS